VSDDEEQAHQEDRGIAPPGLSRQQGRAVEDDLSLLTDREREVLQHIAESKVNKEIADRHLKAEGGPRCASERQDYVAATDILERRRARPAFSDGAPVRTSRPSRAAWALLQRSGIT